MIFNKTLFEYSKKVKKLKERFTKQEEILEGITYEELIATIQSNYGPDANPVQINQTLNEIIGYRLEETKQNIKQNMKFIQVTIRH